MTKFKRYEDAVSYAKSSCKKYSYIVLYDKSEKLDGKSCFCVINENMETPNYGSVVIWSLTYEKNLKIVKLLNSFEDERKKVFNDIEKEKEKEKLNLSKMQKIEERNIESDREFREYYKQRMKKIKAGLIPHPKPFDRGICTRYGENKEITEEKECEECKSILPDWARKSTTGCAYFK